VGIAQQRLLPATERIERDRGRNRHVDTNHARLHIKGEATGHTAIVGKYGRTVTKWLSVDDLQRLLVGVGMHDGEYRTKNLLGVDRGIQGHVVKDCRAEKVPVLVARDL